MRILLTLITSILCWQQSQVVGQIRQCGFRAYNDTTRLKSNHFKRVNQEDLLTIRTVVHIVQTNGVSKISDDQVATQIAVLNEDYQRLNSDSNKTLSVFAEFAANTRISFVLANTDPQRQVTNGVTRKSSDHGPFADNDIFFDSLGGQNIWNPHDYLNIYVTDLADGVFGLASGPDADMAIDGVVIDHQSFGTNGDLLQTTNLGRTTTHEIGHWLGLLHLWGDTPSCENDDGIEDTPAQESASNGCELAKVTCGSLDMVQNFMDLSVDSCMNFFTNGQAERMRSVLKNDRSGVLTTRTITSTINESIKDYVIINYREGIISVNQRVELGKGKLYNLTGQPLTYKTIIVGQETRFELNNPYQGIIIFVLITPSGYMVRKFITGNN